ncbi:hypothetical protein GGQ84_001302 [Desulfitispora alkaliphila]|uniref:hypothetical protein n=1 Tax=Desulfitispora alkaliphila TaxID=622674 RepID=UPI003D1EC33F
MRKNKNSEPDIKALNKKYGFNVGKVIGLWKSNKHDTEISEALDIDYLDLYELRKELESHYLAPIKSYSKGSIHMFTLD